MNTRTREPLMRTRWAAVGAAVAVVLGAGGVSLVGAAVGDGDKPVTVLLDEPCRMRDTRPNKGVGGRETPVGEGEAYTVKGTGESGDCDVPSDAVGLVTNVTAVSPSAPTDLRLYPTGAAVPPTSNLNPAPGQPPTPNSVTVGLNGSGQFDILNKFGEVHVIIDVAGYLVDHHHDDRYVAPWGEIPSGTTVTGSFFERTYIETAGQSIRYMVPLPARTPELLTTDNTGFGPSAFTAIPDAQEDAACTGSWNVPTAPAGKLCVYVEQATGIAVNSAIVVPLNPFQDNAVVLRGDSVGNSLFIWDITWAYTAP